MDIDDKHFNDGMWVFWTIIAGLILLLVVVGMICFSSHKGRVTYDCVSIDAPDGRFWVDIEGRFCFGCGTISSELKESYTVKYWCDGMIKTKILDAEKTPIIVDGTLRVSERVIHNYFFTHNLDEWEVHIPYLPEQSQGLK